MGEDAITVSPVSFYPLTAPESWPYTERWVTQYLEGIGEHFLDAYEPLNLVRHYISDRGPQLLRIVRNLNRCIEEIRSGKFDKYRTADRKEQFISRLRKVPGRNVEFDEWQLDGEKQYDALVAFNYFTSPPDLVALVDRVYTGEREVSATYSRLLTYCEVRERVQRRREERAAAENQVDEWRIVERRHSAIREGFVYILTNPLMAGVVKVGFTAGDPTKRAIEIDQKYSLPTGFAIAERILTRDPYIVEQRVHRDLAAQRIGGEFFRCEIPAALAAVQNRLVPVSEGSREIADYRAVIEKPPVPFSGSRSEMTQGPQLSLFREAPQTIRRDQKALGNGQSPTGEGILCVLTNSLMPDVVFIAASTGEPLRCLVEMTSRYPLPVAFQVAAHVPTEDIQLVRKRTCEALDDVRIAGEFFRCDVAHVLTMLQEYSVPISRAGSTALPPGDWERFLTENKKRSGLALYVTLRSCRLVGLSEQFLDLAPTEEGFRQKLMAPTFLERVTRVARELFSPSIVVRIDSEHTTSPKKSPGF